VSLLAQVGVALGEAPRDPRALWRQQARPEQLMPMDEEWRVLYWQGGRGAGKNRAGAGAMAEWVLGDTDGEGEYGVIAPTYADAWTKCIEGESGLLAALGTNMAEIKDHRSRYVRSAWRTYGQVIFHNGIIVYVDSAAEGAPRVQGRNLKGIWCDEIGLWEKWEVAWHESIKYAVRRGISRIIVTGTPKIARPARRLIRSLIRNDPEHGGVIVRRLYTKDNVENLSPEFYRAVVGTASGTRLEQQELYGDLLDDVANSLWTRDHIDSIHCPAPGEPGGPEYLTRVCIGVDPSDGNETSDEQAFTIVGRGPNEDKHLYVIESWGGQEDPVTFAKRVLRKAVEYDATVVVEKNHGGAWLTSVFRLVMNEMGVTVRLKTVHASHNKRTRAEPVAAMYDRGGGTMVQHCRKTVVELCNCSDKAHAATGHKTPDLSMNELEDQMVTFTGATKERSPDRLDSLVWGCDPFKGMTMGKPVHAKPVKYAQDDAEKDYPAIEELTAPDRESQARKRRKPLPAQNGVNPDPAWALEDFAPKDPDDLPGQPSNGGNTFGWR
jgi:phage terminase large subunit-like protein